MNKLNINLNLYRSFYYVAKYGGFTKASKYALISQSSLSSNIKNLEDILEAKLFERHISNITLTSTGKKLFDQLEEIVNILNDNSEEKELSIGSIRFIADNYLDEIITRFRDEYPNVKINLFFADNTDLYQMLRKDEVDLIICRYPLFYNFEKSISVEKVTDVRNVFVCSKEYYKKEYSNRDVENYVYPLILPGSSEKRRVVEQYLIDHNIIYRVDIELPNSNLLKKLILKNNGIGYINKRFIQSEIDRGELVEIKELNNIPLDNITIIYNSKRKNILTNRFIELLKNIIGKTNT